LYVPTLPTFGGRISQRDCELLACYLTAPYLRIPLVLQFFATQVRVKALHSKRLRDIVDGTLFEPATWQATEQKAVPTVVPSREHLSTPTGDFLFAYSLLNLISSLLFPFALSSHSRLPGLLLNELVMSPTGILQPLKQLLELALEMDTGKYHAKNNAVILYVVRLVVRVQEFILFLILHQQWRASPDFAQLVNGTGPLSFTRGMQCDATTLAQLEEARTWFVAMFCDVSSFALSGSETVCFEW